MSAQREPDGTGKVPSEEFVRQVRQLLEHLYDLPYLQSHPLYAKMLADSTNRGEMNAQGLRRTIISAIEALTPDVNVPFRVPKARIYNLLHLHFVEGYTVEETANELGLSERQAYRDLRSGIQGIAAVLWERLYSASLSAPLELSGDEASTTQVEIERLQAHPRILDICSLLHQAREVVDQLALQHGVSLNIEQSQESILVSVDPLPARQVLISLLSRAIQRSGGESVSVIVRAEDREVSVRIEYRRGLHGPETSVVDETALSLAHRQGWRLEHDEQAGGACAYALRLTGYGATVLVIDDNEGLIELMNRYLTGYPCKTVSATDSWEGLRLADELQPDAIVLDLMMPDTDGWQFLQILRGRADVAHIPVIVCSVLNDPELARSLGASAFLSKPVGQQDIVNALHGLGLV